ncbi:MAG: YbaB/EbfC family nucleoid-associated protein [Myxococcota bacterium]
MNLQEMMRQAKKMQAKMEKVQSELAEKTVEGSAGGGMVTVTANGAQQIVSVQVDKEVVDPEEVEMLQDLFVAAANQALQRAGEMMKEEMGKVTGGMGLPGMF